VRAEHHAPTASFTVNCSALTCGFDASASTDSDGTIQHYTWDFGDGSSGTGVTAQHSYTQSGTYTVLLVVADDNGAEASTTQAVPVAASPNAPPTASFTATCSGLNCSFDATESADSDGTITTYRWDFGDGSGGTGIAAKHSYTQSGSYTVTLTVTDNSAATATTTRPVTLIALTARGSKVKNAQTVDLSWSGSGASVDVYRNGGQVATVAGTGYTDTIGKTGPGNYTYRVCQTTTAICSNQATVTF
jgi:PKD repeat protein